jgi:hypothetical protein
MDKASIVDGIWAMRYSKRIVEYQRQCEEIAASGDENATYSSFPLLVIPELTGLCVMRASICHHRRYKLHDTSTSKLYVISLLPNQPNN